MSKNNTSSLNWLKEYIEYVEENSYSKLLKKLNKLHENIFHHVDWFGYDRETEMLKIAFCLTKANDLIKYAAEAKSFPLFHFSLVSINKESLKEMISQLSEILEQAESGNIPQ